MQRSSKNINEKNVEDRRSTNCGFECEIRQSPITRRVASNFRLKYTAKDLAERRGKYGSERAKLDVHLYETQFKPYLDGFLKLLTDEQKFLFRNFYHLQQAYINNRDPIRRELNRVLDLDDSNLVMEGYRSRLGEVKTTEHNGQRKLLMAELEFLTLYSRDGDTIIYIGASPGHHIKNLIDQFPNLKWLLIDPRSNVNSRIHGKVFIDKSYGTINNPELADINKMDGRKILFMSDIRSGSEDLDDDENYELIKENMLLQQQLVLMIRPRISLLKFRLPYGDGKTWYLKGQLTIFLRCKCSPLPWSCPDPPRTRCSNNVSPSIHAGWFTSRPMNTGVIYIYNL